MSELPAADNTGLELSSPDGTRRFVRLTESPFCIGRGETGNHLQLADSRISRQCAAIISERDSWFLEDDSSGTLRVRLARRSGGLPLSPESVAPSQTALRQALKQQASVITEDLNLADLNLQGAQSIVAQRLRAVVAMPLYAMSRASSPESVVQSKHFLGIVYLDSRRVAAFSKLERQILDALAVEP